MGGGSNDGGFQPAQFTAIDPNQLAQFQATTSGQKYSADDYKALTGGVRGPGYYKAQGGGYTDQGGTPGYAGLASNGGRDLSGMVDEFLKWTTASAVETSNYGAYKDLVKEQPGRDQTILTGPQSGALTTTLLDPSAVRR